MNSWTINFVHNFGVRYLKFAHFRGLKTGLNLLGRICFFFPQSLPRGALHHPHQPMHLHLGRVGAVRRGTEANGDQGKAVWTETWTCEWKGKTGNNVSFRFPYWTPFNTPKILCFTAGNSNDLCISLSGSGRGALKVFSFSCHYQGMRWRKRTRGRGGREGGRGGGRGKEGANIEDHEGRRSSLEQRQRPDRS